MSLWAENRQICLAVEDYGIGVPNDEQDKLFSRFFRASTAQGVPRTGVGLSTSHQLELLLGGDLEFVSRSGIGSVFTLKLPGEWADPNVGAFGLGTAEFRSAVLTAAMALGVNVYLFADLYGNGGSSPWLCCSATRSPP